MRYYLIFCLTFLLLAGCSKEEQRAVVIYTSLDQQFSEPILNEFERRTGIDVQAVYDTEAVKTVGLVNRLLSERDRPVADVFWNNEIVRTVQLKREGITQPYHSPSADGIPDKYKDSEGHWTGFAARGRVIMVNTQRIPNPEDYPDSIDDLTDPKWKGQAGFAKPLFGTTSTHAAIIWSQRGRDESLAYWRAVLDNAHMYAGNAQARDAAANGEVAWCMTDTDDAQGAALDGKPVAMRYSDAGEGQSGAILLPNTLALIRNCPHPEEGKALIDYLLSPEVEEALAKARGAQIPLRPGVPGPVGLPPLDEANVAEIDWEAVADVLLESQDAMKQLLDESGV